MITRQGPQTFLSDLFVCFQRGKHLSRRDSACCVRKLETTVGNRAKDFVTGQAYAFRMEGHPDVASHQRRHWIWPLDAES